MQPFFSYFRHSQAYRLHLYMNDVLVANSTWQDLDEIRSMLNTLMQGCELARFKGEGCWDGSTTIDYLAFIIAIKQMVFGIKQRQLVKINGISRSLLSQARKNRILFDAMLLRHFNGVAILCLLAESLALF